MKPKRLLAILLSLVMTMSLFPATAFAAGDTGQGETMRVFHLDCGRKYFSEQQIKNLIDEMAQDGYNYLELAVGNDGLRFLLDDMSLKYSIGASAVEAEEEEPAVRLMEEESPAEEMPAAAPEARAAGSSEYSFTSDAVKNAIKTGNKTYTMASSGELTQTEMDRIISYAEEKDISIIPLVNTPGHMDAILSAAQSLTEVSGLAYSSSKTTIDVTNPEAVAFTQALLQKYITYFANQGCTYFNMGADEYANDIFTFGGMGFGNLALNGNYKDFIHYINAVAEMIQTAGMTPIAFNDGIRYNGQEPVQINRDIIVSYWSSGWGGYNVASAADLANTGFQILNTSGNWYYVLKTGASDINRVKEQISNTPWTSVMGSTVDRSKLVGAMVCLWCDEPGFTYSEENTKAQIKAFAEKNSDIFTIKPVVEDLPFTVGTTAGNSVESEPLTTAGLNITQDETKTLTYTGEGIIEAGVVDHTDAFRIDVKDNNITVTALKGGTGILRVAVTAEGPMTRAAAGTTEYSIPITVTVTPKPLETTTLKAEFWCTNARVIGEGVNADEMTISFTEVNKPVFAVNGVPKTGKSDGNTGRYYVYWKSVILPAGQHQTGMNGDDKTNSGTEIIAVMYDGTDYYYYSKVNPNTAVKIKPTDQLVSYYKQVFVRLQSGHAVIAGADWGEGRYYNWAPNSVQYTITEMDENGRQIGSQSSTMWYGTDGQIKDIGAPVNDGYEVYKATVKKGNSTTTYGEGGSQLVPEDLTLDRGSNYEVTYFIRPVKNLKVTYQWLGAPAGEALPEDDTTYAKNATVTVDTAYTDGKTLQVGTDEYTFHGWYKNNEYKGEPVTSFTITLPTTLYGYWTKTDAIKLEIKAASGTKVYDGTALTNNAYTVSYAGQELTKGTDGYYTANGIQFKLNEDVNVTGAQTDAGESDNTISGTKEIVYKDTGTTAATFKNVAWVNGTLTVTKRNVTITSANLSKEYDGKALTNGNTALATESGWVDGEGASYTFTGSQKAVGSSANSFTYTLKDGTKADNYVITKTEGTLTVTDNGGSGGGGGGGGTTYYILQYESNGGTSYKDERYTSGATVKLDKVPTREGYAFTGWYADEALTEKITNVRMNSARTVYAGWNASIVPDMLNGDDHFAYVIGYSDGLVRPTANISRAEAATIFFRLLKDDIRDENLTSYNIFDDVTEGMWCNKSISTMAKLGIVKGRSTNRFDPNANITRAEFAAICARFDTGLTNGDSNFTDISGHWAEAEIKRAASLGWIRGCTDGSFCPDTYITRAEAMTMINRVLCRILENEDDLLHGMNVWPDNQPDAWYYLAVQEATNSHNFKHKGEIYETWTRLTDDPDWTRYQN